MTDDAASQATSRGEYATALNCTMTKASEKTRPVSGNMPEAIAESRARAGAVPLPLNSGRNRASSRGTSMPSAMATTA